MEPSDPLGRMLEARELSLEALHDYAACVARVGRALRGFFHPAAQQVLLWDVRHAARLRPLLPHIEDDDARALVERVLDRFEERVAPVFDHLRAQVIHGDMTLDDVLLDERGSVTGVIDETGASWSARPGRRQRPRDPPAAGVRPRARRPAGRHAR